MTITLYDLVTEKGNGAFFSSNCFPARLALMAKQIPFETEEVTFHDLRFTWTPRIGVETATAPFIRREDGSFLMDSVEIALWLDRAYPDRQNLLLPEATLPVDVDSAEYREAKAALQDILELRDAVDAPIQLLYGSRITKMLDSESSAYWKSKADEGEWEQILAAEKDERPVIAEIQRRLKAISDRFLRDGRHFIASASRPGFADFLIAGQARQVQAVSPRLFREIFRGKEVGGIPAWYERIRAEYPTPEVEQRDPTCEV